MRNAALLLVPTLLGTAALASTTPVIRGPAKPLSSSKLAATAQVGTPYVQPQVVTPMAQPQVATAAYDINYALSDWRRLRQSSGYSFADYARFLLNNPEWPGEAAMRRNAERSMRPGENPATVLAFFHSEKPQSGNGYARLADALSASGRHAEALAAAREAWASASLSATDETSIYARFGPHLSWRDHERRADALLFDKKTADAYRFLSLVSAARRPAFNARVAMQSRAPNADSLYQAAMGMVTTDAGLMMDRARYLRETGYESAARQLAARDHNFAYKPADPDRFLEMLLLLADGAGKDRQWSTAYNIARQLDDLFPAGTDLTAQPLGVRDKYTSLAWLGGTAAWTGLNRPADAAAMFDRYSRGGRSLQVLTKGLYWAGRASIAGGQLGPASAFFQRAAAYPELFYGQLALERMGRTVPAPGTLPTFAVGPQQRAIFANNRLVRAVRLLGQQGRADEQAVFIRALAESLDNDAERVMAMELARQIGRQDLPVWIARAARNNGSAFYVADAFPQLGARVPGGRVWSLAHGITRQESSFDRNAVSHAGARGMMQLMPGTAREQAGKMGLGYDPSRLTTDPSYNVQLGTAYFQRLLNMWDGNVPLALASYNAGAGNVRRWVNTYGDPRYGNRDVLQWIEQIPFMETRGYVQRVIENSVVYDQMNPSTPSTPVHVSSFLGKNAPG